MKCFSANRVTCSIRVDAGRQNTDQTLDTNGMTEFDHIGVHCEVLLKKANLVVHVSEQPAYLGS